MCGLELKGRREDGDNTFLQTSVNTCQTTWYLIQQNSNLHTDIASHEHRYFLKKKE
jgi:hypothetical protein